MSKVESKYTIMRSKSDCIIVGILSFLFSFAIPVIIDEVLAQSSVLTDLDAPTYYSNPDRYVNNKVNFTGKIFAFPPSDKSGVYILQMYQGGDSDRNTIVLHTSPFEFSKDDCVRVMGTSQQTTSFRNLFGGVVSAAVVNAGSVNIIPCSESINPAKKVVTVEQSQEDNGIKVRLHKVEFSDKNTRVYLTVENNDPSEDMTFYNFNAKAIQGHTQFAPTYSFDTTYPKIESTIPSGIQENGVVLFEPLDPSQDSAQFRFESRKGIDTSKFIFDVIVSPMDYYNKVMATNPNDIHGLHEKGVALFNLGNYTEAIKYFDKVLAINSSNIFGLENKGAALFNLGNYTEAIKYFDKVLAIDPGNSHALELKCNSY